MEACAGSYCWAREIGAFGREVRLIAPAYVKSFVKRQKNDAADAEAIAEAALCPAARFVAEMSAEEQNAGMRFKTQDLPAQQKTQAINRARGHLAERGVIGDLEVEVHLIHPVGVHVSREYRRAKIKSPRHRASEATISCPIPTATEEDAK